MPRMPRRAASAAEAIEFLTAGGGIDPYALLVYHTQFAFTPAQLEEGIARLREAETAARKGRKRLEALLHGTGRHCPQCGNPVTGRADAVYCGTTCRVAAHRGQVPQLRGLLQVPGPRTTR
jgi:hypothetical protein